MNIKKEKNTDVLFPLVSEATSAHKPKKKNIQISIDKINGKSLKA